MISLHAQTVSEQWIGSSWDRRATRAKDVVPTGGPKPKYNPEELQAIREKQAKTFEEIKYRLVLDHVFAVLLLSSVVWGVAGLKVSSPTGCSSFRLQSHLLSAPIPGNN
jgi:hypothetical protein